MKVECDNCGVKVDSKDIFCCQYCGLNFCEDCNEGNRCPDCFSEKIV